MKHKNYYNYEYIKELSIKIYDVNHDFNHNKFCQELFGQLESKELSERLDCIVDAMQRNLNNNYSSNIETFFDILGAELEQSEGMFTLGWWLWPIARYVERYGNENWQLSLAFIKELTKRFTGEFAIRPLLKDHPIEILNELIEWTKDPNVHVRRLASEGVRIRLPWSRKLLVALENFELYTTLITNLKDDPEKYVQKSVGNNINDLYKDAPEKAEWLVSKWETTGHSKAQDWIIKHGMRTKNKKIKLAQSQGNL